MAGQSDLQELLRIFTSRKIPMMASMKHVQSLQSQGLRSIGQIAEAPLATVEAAISDTKLAKSVHTACKTHGKKAKRPAEESADPPSKKTKLELHRRDLDYSSMSPDELESSLTLPVVEDEDLIRATTLVTNRAPLVLAFAVELLRVTMPEQPPSSRLSLSQAVVSANSRSKAVSLGIEKPHPAGDGLVSEGQPRVRVLGREIPVLKRGGYTWSEAPAPTASSTASSATAQASQSAVSQSATSSSAWTASQRLTSRESTFIAHVVPLKSPSSRPELMKALMKQKPELETATHNAWAVRASYGNSPLVQEASFDDGESGCGKFLLQVMRESDVTNTLVVLTRWYGGVMLGPDRWRLMRECVSDALSSQKRATGTTLSGGDAVWGLDAHDTQPASSTVGMAIHRPEGARNYLLRAFARPSADEDSSKKTVTAINEEKQENLGRLLGALRLLYASWAGVLTAEELDRRAWGWYIAVRPEVESGPAGWGAKGALDLSRILDLRRKETAKKD